MTASEYCSLGKRPIVSLAGQRLANNLNSPFSNSIQTPSVPIPTCPPSNEPVPIPCSFDSRRSGPSTILTVNGLVQEDNVKLQLTLAVTSPWCAQMYCCDQEKK